jgi:Arc/MetJ-type ribon-helix-helix transcriptional regulator
VNTAIHDKVEHRNVTLSLPEPLLRRFRVYAASRNLSMSHLMNEAIEKMIDEEGERQAAARRLIDGMRNSPDRGIGGKITWTREELYER